MLRCACEAMHVLLQGGARLDVREVKGNDPLHVALEASAPVLGHRVTRRPLRSHPGVWWSKATPL